MEKYIFTSLLSINVISYLFFRQDKINAKNGKWRISEFTLLTTTLFGGTIGSLLSMKIYHHKTKKISFLLKLFLIISLQLTICYLLYTSSFEIFKF